ncbi:MULTISPECIES: serine hydrolase [Flavobacteriaceae]|uniref:serine hydrolase domain-containing protein n=1 Tax=Flavobacteriaceae TaxID=49546 RepID=UPI0014914428|nr:MULTISPECIES: serine hydrolase domain-containing protein [Allomuricauda]MDC6366350.1 serine hydrolase [Muricauda sp. AC10]
MKNGLQLLWACTFLLAVSCTPETKKDTPQKNMVKQVSRTYKHPVFENDGRLQKIKELETELQQIFEEHALDRKIPGIAYGIVVDDSLIIASATGVSEIENKTPVTTRTSFRIASMTKSFTAMAILKLRDEGKLSLNDPVEKYIPELQSLEYLTGDAPILDIENLMTMTAGFPEDNPWGDRQLAMGNEDFMALVAKGLSMSKIPSSEYEYSNTGYAMLGYIVSKVSGTAFQEYIQNQILLPLGMNETYWEYANVPKKQLAHGYRWEDEMWKEEPMLHDGAFGSMGGLITSIEDFSKYVSFHLAAWPSRSDGDNGPVKRSSVREMHTPQFNFLNSWNRDRNNEPCARMIGYGYGLGISMDCKRITRISHGGALPGFGSNYAFFPDYGIGIMAFGNRTYTGPVPYDKIEQLLFETLDLQTRKLPVSDILKKRKEDILDLINNGKVNLDAPIFADNFFLDRSKDKRTQEIQEILDKAGAIKKSQDIRPRNQLRGDFTIECKNGTINIFFTLTPEKNPMIQRLDVSFSPNEK